MTADKNTTHHQKILRLRAVKEATGLPRSTIYLYIRQNLFPKNVKIGVRSVGWFEADVIAWQNERRGVGAKEQID